MSQNLEIIPFSEYIEWPTEYPDFRAATLTANSLVRREPVAEFDGIKGGMYNGDTAGTFLPHPNDKEELLELAFSLSKQHNRQADVAMLLGAALPIIHPFLDGNGRTSRAIHAVLAGKSDAEIAQLGIAQWHDADSVDGLLARRVVDLAPPAFLRHGHIEETIYRQSGVSKHYFGVSPGESYDEGLARYTAVLDACETDLKDDIKGLFTIYPPEEWQLNCWWADDLSLAFALNATSNSGGDLVTTQKYSDERSSAGDYGCHYTTIDMPQTLELLGTDGRQYLVDQAWRYRKLAATVALQCLSADNIGQDIITINNHTTTAAKHYQKLSNNLL